jgi:transcriptional regulator with XRE-family HTH domain
MRPAPHDPAVPEWTLGWRLQRALGHAGLSISNIASEMGVSRTTVSRWINDRGTPPRLVYVKEWALQTGVPCEWLLTGRAEISA